MNCSLSHVQTVPLHREHLGVREKLVRRKYLLACARRDGIGRHMVVAAYAAGIAYVLQRRCPRADFDGVGLADGLTRSRAWSGRAAKELGYLEKVRLGSRRDRFKALVRQRNRLTVKGSVDGHLHVRVRINSAELRGF